MGIPSELRDAWTNRNRSLLIASPIEDEKILRSRQCTQVDCLSNGTLGKGKSQLYCSGTHYLCRCPSLRILICFSSRSPASIAAYFITADKTILECARRNAQYDRSS
ncbi:uncharacterized protein LOC111374868 isoform X2 [Olea europaea var. sylvestris]|uniref:uncharacterized protein LOC111374868 isoform X2 n=1 Tax=Olea europaea var. sylvestris TaxID=158386 RepID=UPI000C1D4E4A|nr:uncharacterized protein LOC111374868 isoform X2 [Olea europaea var. sylvestris]